VSQRGGGGCFNLFSLFFEREKLRVCWKKREEATFKLWKGGEKDIAKEVRKTEKGDINVRERRILWRKGWKEERKEWELGIGNKQYGEWERKKE
jgi:hypothetical protein